MLADKNSLLSAFPIEKKNGVSEAKKEQKIGTATPDRTEI